MKERERLAFERREMEQRSFANFDPSTGVIVQVWWCQIPPDVLHGEVAVFDNVHWSNALDHRVDLNTLRDVADDHPHCKLIKATMQ